MIAVELLGEEIIAHFVDHRAGKGIIITADLSRLMRANRQADARTADGRGPFTHGDERGGLRVADDDFVRSGSCDHHSAARGTDGVAVTGVDTAQTQIQTPLRRRGDKIGVVELINRKFAGLIKRDAAGADIEIGGCAGLGPKRVAGGDRLVQRRRFPMILIGTVK